MRAARSSSEVDRAWSDLDLDDNAPAPVVAATTPAPRATLARGSQPTLDAILEDLDSSVPRPQLAFDATVRAVIEAPSRTMPPLAAPDAGGRKPNHDATSIVMPLPLNAPSRPGSDRLAFAAPEPLARQALRRHRRWIIAVLACAAAGAGIVAFRWAQSSNEPAGVTVPPVAIAATAPAKVAPVATPAAQLPVATKQPASMITAKPIRSNVHATKHELPPAKKAVKSANIASSTKKPAAKPARPRAVKPR